MLGMLHTRSLLSNAAFCLFSRAMSTTSLFAAALRSSTCLTRASVFSFCRSLYLFCANLQAQLESDSRACSKVSVIERDYISRVLLDFSLCQPNADFTLGMKGKPKQFSLPVGLSVALAHMVICTRRATAGSRSPFIAAFYVMMPHFCPVWNGCGVILCYEDNDASQCRILLHEII